MALTVTTDTRRVIMMEDGHAFLSGSIAFDSSYPTGGESCTDITKYFKSTEQIMCEASGGYIFAFDKTNSKIKVYLPSGTPTVANANESAHTHAVALDSGSSAAGSSHTHAGAALELATPVFSGTGLTAAGQVVTTTDNQTMTLNQCAGMWLIPATGATPAVLILSNTAVTGAPAVLTVQGAAMTDAGAYKIVKSATSGAEAAHTHGAGTLADAASGTGSAHTHTTTVTGEAADEVGNTTDLSALTAVKFIAIGRI